MPLAPVLRRPAENNAGLAGLLEPSQLTEQTGGFGRGHTAERTQCDGLGRRCLPSPVHIAILIGCLALAVALSSS